MVVLPSLSAAMDGGFTAIADVSAALATAGATDDYRLIGGVTVLLHIKRLGLDLPLRATGDADFGVPPHMLQRPELIDAIESLGYRKVHREPLGAADRRATDCCRRPPRAVVPHEGA